MARLSARIEMQTPPEGLPDTLWFEFPESYRAWLSPRADAFVVSLLLTAMERGEDIEACAPLSPHLRRGIEEYQRLFHIWRSYLRLVSIRSEDDDSVQEATPCAVGCAFSGGADSFFTLYSHLPAREPLPDYRITHALFLHGFDVPLEDEATYAQAAGAYQGMMETLNIAFVPVRTNSRDFVRHLDWQMAHGVVLLGAALALEPMFSRFYIPSSQYYGETAPWGSDYRTDPLLSTQTMQFVNDGASYTRVEKINAFAHWPEAYARLRVCWEKLDGLNNCCVCSKCVRTMAALEVCGALPHYTTFPLPFTRRQVRNCHLEDYEFDQIDRAIEHAAAAGRSDVVADLRYALRRARLRTFLGRNKRRVRSWFVRS
ncbi:MAG TPA: hypothetical protein VFB21_01460 [Chthonomonadaceae bacterium]|nr:hypothetical protein [Chthonomonadaceae bacterium]